VPCTYYEATVTSFLRVTIILSSIQLQNIFKLFFFKWETKFQTYDYGKAGTFFRSCDGQEMSHGVGPEG
jgi:hypothetical protein